ncbi:hypothetical protein ABEB36_012601 [Hypothenemus hampei]|uniref:Uncharacterized protein n=1 Tax=Hypothenemus hampei TaxID=57062 RepID=A0ABD1EC13_HYPHA
MLKLSIILLFSIMCAHTNSFPTNEDYKFIERDYASPGVHQLASWLALQLRPKELIAPVDIPLLPYRLPIQNSKRNSEVTNAMIGSQETQKMYREGRK